MKRILSAALALCMVMSLSVTVFASPDTNIVLPDDSQASTSVNARKDNDTISAEVEWGTMNFVYDVGASTWRVEGEAGNIFTLTNTSKSAKIKATYWYDLIDETKKNSIGLFSSPIHSYKVGSSGSSVNPNIALLSSSNDGGVGVTPEAGRKGGVLGTSSFEQYYVMFTGNENYSKLSNSSEPVGTLKITIEQAN
jgi:hypothetical protein